MDKVQAFLEEKARQMKKSVMCSIEGWLPNGQNMLLSSAEFLASSHKEEIPLEIFSGALAGVGVLSCEGTLIKIVFLRTHVFIELCFYKNSIVI